jgi:diguanylate cyclase (GGDEF)-like protein/PAS domain S-box-containing protein
MLICVVFGPQLAGWTESSQSMELAALTLAAMLTSGLRVQQSSSRDRAIMPPSFVIILASLLLFGPHAAALVAIASAVTPIFATSSTHNVVKILVDATILAVATEVAGLAQGSLVSLLGTLVWPWRALPTAAAVIAYHIAQGTLAELADALLSKRPVDRSWPRRALRGYPVYMVGASVAVGLVELIDDRTWQVLPVVAASLFFAYHTYADYVSRLDEDHRRREVIDFLEQGMAAVDRHGRVTFWNDALERLLGCPRDRVLGQVLQDGVPAVSRTELPRVIKETLADGAARTTSAITVPSPLGTRALEVKVVPIADGVALLWHDVTERVRAEHELKRSGERLALAAEGANDGLWQWNLQTQEFYVSARWRAMIGLSPVSMTGRPEEWLDRVHPEDIAALRQTLDAHLAGQTDVFQHEHRIRHEDGTYRRFLCRGVAVSGRAGRRVRIAGSLTDTTEQAIAQERLRSVGFIDPLTGLYNRAVFVEGLGRNIEEFRLGRLNNSFAVLYLDLDRFKIVNDSLGHLVGDELLIAVSRRLESCLRQGDALARLGGDEFAILLNRLADDNQANAIAFRIQDALSSPFSIGGREVFTSASIGIAFGPAHYTNPDEVMRDADTAMYHAKSRGKARHEIFDEAMHARVRDRLSLENDLRRAIGSNDFEVAYQPIVSLATGMCIGFESLVRWTRNGEPISPATFVPIAEELGLIEPLGTWVMQQACCTFAEWQRKYPTAGLDCITVNVSSRQLVQQNFPRVVQQAVLEAGLKPADVRVEITETALLDNPGEAAGVLRELRNFGVKVYLDDFGTGYSSLSHLHKLPVDALKIDRSFVKSLLLPDRPAIVESILALARTLNTSVVAEGIEEEIQARELERLGCMYAQGFLFSRPLLTEAAEQLVKAHLPLGPKRLTRGEPAPAPSPAPAARTAGGRGLASQRSTEPAADRLSSGARA